MDFRKDLFDTTKYLFKKMGKNPENISDPEVRAIYGRIAGSIGIFGNLLIGGGKILTGLIFSSISVLADGINNLSDALSSLVTLISFQISSRPADQKHPFGHARMEYISGLVIAVLILVVGFNLIGSSIEKVFHPEETPFSWITAGILIVSILGKCGLMVFHQKIGRKIESEAVKAAAMDSRNDVIATATVLLSVFVEKWTGLQLDGWMGLLIGLFILWSGIGLISDTISPILGEAPDKNLVHKTAEKLHSYEGVLGIHDLMIHDYGPGRCFASVHIEVDARDDIMRSHDLCDSIERDFASNGLNLVVHMDPVVTDDEELNGLQDAVRKIIYEIDNRMSIHDFRMVKGYSHTNIIFDIAVPSEYSLKDDEFKNIVQEKVSAIDPSRHYFTVIRIDRNYTNLD